AVARMVFPLLCRRLIAEIPRFRMVTTFERKAGAAQHFPRNAETVPSVGNGDIAAIGVRITVLHAETARGQISRIRAIAPPLSMSHRLDRKGAFQPGRVSDTPRHCGLRCPVATQGTAAGTTTLGNSHVVESGKIVMPLAPVGPRDRDQRQMIRRIR